MISHCFAPFPTISCHFSPLFTIFHRFFTIFTISHHFTPLFRTIISHHHLFHTAVSHRFSPFLTISPPPPAGRAVHRHRLHGWEEGFHVRQSEVPGSAQLPELFARSRAEIRHHPGEQRFLLIPTPFFSYSFLPFFSIFLFFSSHSIFLSPPFLSPF